jgi:hypothetical protein
MEQAIRTLIATFELKGPKYEDGKLYAPDYLDIPPDVREYAEIIADLSLYKNCTELLCNDSRLAFIIYVEAVVLVECGLISGIPNICVIVMT